MWGRHLGYDDQLTRGFGFVLASGALWASGDRGPAGLSPRPVIWVCKGIAQLRRPAGVAGTSHGCPWCCRRCWPLAAPPPPAAAGPGFLVGFGEAPAPRQVNSGKQFRGLGADFQNFLVF